MLSIGHRDAVAVVQSLKAGVPPRPRLAPALFVGRARWLDGMNWYLDAALEHGLSAVRLIVGDYGSGKTHFLRMAEWSAIQRRFAVCEVTLTPQVRLDRFETVWRQMMGNLATVESAGEPQGIEGILNRWCEQAYRSPHELSRELEGLDSLVNLDPDFRKALRGYLREWEQGGDRDAYLQWLKGDPIRPPGVRTRIDRQSARAMLRSLIEFLRHIGYAGLVLVFDEVEVVHSQSRPIRNVSYDTLRQFIDGADNVRNFLLLCSLTPMMLQDESRGIPSYDALWTRVRTLDQFDERDSRAITINLDRIPLTQEDLLELAKRIRSAHATAIGWDAESRLPDGILAPLASAAAQQAEIASPRYLVQAVVTALERLQQDPQLQAESALPRHVEIVESVREHDRRRYRPWNG